MEPTQQPQEMIVYKCTKCGGDGKQINDWTAYNNLGLPIGFSEAAAKRHHRNYERAYGPCSQCNGKGFTLEPKP